jgi:protein-tyrosine phosphatase
MQVQQQSPTGSCYWAQPGLLLAGSHPGAAYKVKAQQTLRQLLEAGVTVFIDLTEKDEYYEYERLLEGETWQLRKLVAYYRLPTRDGSIPSITEMKTILNWIDTATSAGRTVYLHCVAGRGRTGTVVGCYLVRHGMKGEEALQEIRQLRRDMMLGGNLSSSQHPAQIEMVMNWRPGE